MIARRTLLLFARTAAIGVLNMLGTAITARLLGAEALGTVGYLVGLTGTLSVATDLGYSIAFTRRVAGRKSISQDIGTFAAIKGALAVLLVLTILALPIVDRYSPRSLLDSRHLVPFYLVGAFRVFGLLASIFLRTFAAQLEAAKLAVVGLGGAVILLIARGIVAWRGWGIEGLCGALAVEAAASLAVGALLFRGYRIGRPSVQLFRDYTAYALPQMALIALTAVTGNLDRLMLGRLSGATEVGYYVAVLGVLTLTGEVAREFMSLFLPRVSQDANAADYRSMQRRLKGALKYLLLALVPLIAASIVMRDWWVRAYLGAAFAPAAPVAALLALSVIPSSIARTYRNILLAVEQHHRLVEARLAGLLILAASGALLMPYSIFGIPAAGLGATGAALAVLLKELVECVYTVGLSARYARIGFWREALWYMVAGVLLTGTASAVLAPLSAPNALVQLFALAAGLVLYAAFLYVVGQLRRSEAILLLDTLDPAKLLSYIRSELRTVAEDVEGEASLSEQDVDRIEH